MLVIVIVAVVALLLSLFLPLMYASITSQSMYIIQQHANVMTNALETRANHNPQGPGLSHGIALQWRYGTGSKAKNGEDLLPVLSAGSQLPQVNPQPELVAEDLIVSLLTINQHQQIATGMRPLTINCGS